VCEQRNRNHDVRAGVQILWERNDFKGKWENGIIQPKLLVYQREESRRWRKERRIYIYNVNLMWVGIDVMGVLENIRMRDRWRRIYRERIIASRIPGGAVAKGCPG